MTCSQWVSDLREFDMRLFSPVHVWSRWFAPKWTVCSLGRLLLESGLLVLGFSPNVCEALHVEQCRTRVRPPHTHTHTQQTTVTGPSACSRWWVFTHAHTHIASHKPLPSPSRNAIIFTTFIHPHQPWQPNTHTHTPLRTWRVHQGTSTTAGTYLTR